MPPTDERGQHSFIGAQGLALVGDMCGRADAPPVLLLHGGGQTRHSWRHALPLLASRGYLGMALDLRGHGDSEWSPSGAYGIGDFAADVAMVCGQLQAPPVLVGASLGGLASLLAVGEGHHPICRGLALVDIALRSNPAGASRITSFMEASPQGFASLEDAAASVAGYLPHRAKVGVSNGLARNLRLRGGRYHWHWDPAFLERAKRGEANIHQRYAAAAVRIKEPVLLVRAAESDIIDATSLENMRRHIPHAQEVVVLGAHHMVAGDSNDEFNEAILSFLDGLAAPHSKAEQVNDR